MYIKYILIFRNIGVREYEEMDYNVNISVLEIFLVNVRILLDYKII